MDDLTIKKLQTFLGKVDGDYVTKSDFKKSFQIFIEVLKELKTVYEEKLRKAETIDIRAEDKIIAFENIINPLIVDLENKISILSSELPKVKESIPDTKPLQKLYSKLGVKIDNVEDLFEDLLSKINEQNLERRVEILEGIIEELRKSIDDLLIFKKGQGGTSTGTIFGGGSRTRFIDDETPAGTINGSNATFTTSKAPLTGSLKVYRGGARQRVTEDYTFDTKTITFTIAPEVGEVLLVDYRY